MKRVRRMISRLRIALFGDSRAADLEDELEAHIQMQIDDNLRAGMPPEIARRAAIFGTKPFLEVAGEVTLGDAAYVQATELIRIGAAGLALKGFRLSWIITTKSTDQ